MNDVIEVTPGLQCCLLCGRTLTDRALHDRLEEPVINAIRLEHPEWAGAGDGTCAPCLSAYRKLLEGRITRAERRRIETENQNMRARLGRFFFRGKISVTENQPSA